MRELDTRGLCRHRGSRRRRTQAEAWWRAEASHGTIGLAGPPSSRKGKKTKRNKNSRQELKRSFYKCLETIINTELG